MRKGARVLIALAGVALAVVAVGRWKQPEIGAAVFERAARARVGRDVTAELPDGLSVALCGTGSPLPSADRAGPCTVVIAGRHMFIVDIGEGGARNIALMGLPVGRVEGVFLTHFHSDHIDGMGPLVLTRWTAASNRAPLPVFGPEGVEQVVAGFDTAYAADNGYRTAHHGPAIAPPTGAGAIARPFALTADAVTAYEGDGLKVTAIRVDHGPVKPAVGYRFDYKGRSVVISGDTAKSVVLAAASRGADLLVHDALQPALVRSITGALGARAMPKLAQITRDIASYHATPAQAAEVAQAAGVRQLVLSHLVPPLPSRFFYPAFLGDAATRFSGSITIGEDGMMFVLPTGTDRIDEKRLM